MAPIDLDSTANTHLPLFLLPQEILDMIFSFIFAETKHDIPLTRDAELRIFEKHLILRRTWQIPPPSWKGCRNVFKTCKAFYANGLNTLYSQMAFTIRINGDDDDPGQTRSRLHSDYPFGKLEECLPLQYLGAVQLSLSAGSAHELQRLETRVRAFDRAIQRSPKLRVTAIRLSLGRLVVTEDVYAVVSTIMSMMLQYCKNDEIKEEALTVKVFTNPGNDIPKPCLVDLVKLIRGIDAGAFVSTYSKGMVLL